MTLNWMQPARVWSVLLASLAAACLVSCGESTSGETGEITEITEGSETVRIVTLAPALTQMLIDLNLDDLLVGVAENDRIAPPDITVAGTFTQPDAESILTLKPTHVLMMVGKDGVPADLRELGIANGFDVISYSYPNSVKDVADIIFNFGELLPIRKPAEGEDAELPTPSLGRVFGIVPEAGSVRYTMEKRLAGLGQIVDDADVERPRVLMVIAAKPVMASGTGTVLHELLYFAGGVNAANVEYKTENSADTAPEFTKEGLLEIRPDVVFYFDPGGDAIENMANPRLIDFRGLEDIPALENKRVYVIDDPNAMLPSTSMPAVCAQMIKLLHPQLAGEVDKFMATPIELQDIADYRARQIIDEPQTETDDEAIHGDATNDEADAGDESGGDAVESSTGDGGSSDPMSPAAPDAGDDATFENRDDSSSS